MKRTILLISWVLILFGCNTGTKDHNTEKKDMFRGFMIDAPRGVETIDSYFRLIDFCSDEGLNVILFRLTDDQGSAYLFKSHPELKMSEGALSAEELKSIVEYANKKGVEIIPEIESFGHARYITDTERYRHLDDAPEGAYFSAICPVNDTTLMLFKDLYAEVAPIFKSKYFHIGCDEVNWGHGELSEKALLTKSRTEIWSAYVNKLNSYVEDLGKETIIWGDVPIRHDEKVLDYLDKDIVIVDWNYRETNTDSIRKTANNILNRGFKLISCPAVYFCRWELRVGAYQFENIGAYADVYNNLDHPGNLGIILSNWIPTRYLQNSQWDTYFIAANLVNGKYKHGYKKFLPTFVKEHFGADYDKDWENIYTTLYEKMPEWIECRHADSLMFIPWNSEKHIKDLLADDKPPVNNFKGMPELMLQNRNNVVKNREDYESLIKTVNFIDYCFNRQIKLYDFIRLRHLDPVAVKKFFTGVMLEDQKQLSVIDSAWHIGRRTKNPEKINRSYLWAFNKAARYSKYLSENPKDFIEIINSGK